MGDFFAIVLLSLFIVCLGIILLLPTVIAHLRRCQNIGLIFLVNILGVWIGIGALRLGG